MHDFDQFFGNLYHLNAQEEPKNWHYPGDPVAPGRIEPGPLNLPTAGRR
jgi:hypothetical protein